MGREGKCQVLLHHALATHKTHKVMLGPPAIKAGPVQVAWQPWPLKSLIYAWVFTVGPVYLIDAARHCVPAKMHLQTSGAHVEVGPWQMVVQAPGGDTSASPYYDDKLWKLHKMHHWASFKVAWKPTGTGLVLFGRSAMGYVSFAAT